MQTKLTILTNEDDAGAIVKFIGDALINKTVALKSTDIEIVREYVDDAPKFVKGYAMVNVPGKHGYSMLCKTDETDDDAILNKLLTLGQMDRDEAYSALIEYSLAEDDIRGFGIYDLDGAWEAFGNEEGKEGAL